METSYFAAQTMQTKVQHIPQGLAVRVVPASITVAHVLAMDVCVLLPSTHMYIINCVMGWVGLCDGTTYTCVVCVCHMWLCLSLQVRYSFNELPAHTHIVSS